MTVYYLFYLVFFLYSGLVYVNKRPLKNQNRRITKFGFLLIFALFACRHPYMGVDLMWGYRDGYWGSFKVLNYYNWDEILKIEHFKNYERGYIIFNKLVGSIYNEPQFFLAICALLSLLPIAIYTAERSDVPLLSVCVFVGLPIFHIFFSGLRQGIAIGITVVAMHFVERKKLIRFVLTVIAASKFHYSAMIFLIAYPLYYLRFNDVGKLFCLMLLPMIYLLKEHLFVVFSKLFKESAAVEDTGAITLFLVFVLIYAFLAVFNSRYDKRQNGLINLCYVACVCQAFGGVSNIATRVGYYFMVYMIIAIPNTMENFRTIKIRYNSYYTLIKLALIMIFVIYGLYSIKHGSWSRSYPYFYFWQFGDV